MVPAAFVRLEAFPLTPNGKLDRRALPLPDEEAYARAAYEVPQGEIETVLAAIWSELLGVERISRTDNFFHLGGHSFLALRVISDINKKLKLHLTAPTFFLYPTIAALAKELEHSHHAQTQPRVLTLRAGHTGLPIYLMGARPEEFRLGQLIGGDRRIFTVDIPFQTAWLSAFKRSDIKALPTIEQLGTLYGETLAAHAGASPCVVAGYSLGGKIAFEAARVLQDAGGNVAFVLLLDARAFTWRSYTLWPALESFGRIWHSATRKADDIFLLQRLSTSLRDSWTVIRWLLSRAPDSVRYRFNAIKTRLNKLNRSRTAAAVSTLPSGYFDEGGRPIETLLVNKLALAIGRLWHPRTLDAPGVLIRADNSEDMLPGKDVTNGWEGLFTGGLEILQTGGDHHSMVTEENAALLAGQMNLILGRYEAAQNEGAGSLGHEMNHGDSKRQQKLGQAPPQPERTVA
jgi:thioesterase domain-containing protein